MGLPMMPSPMNPIGFTIVSYVDGVSLGRGTRPLIYGKRVGDTAACGIR